jgi:DNA-binding NtrC family response regulator
MTEDAKVLIVDDNQGIRTALATLFDVHGIPALTMSTPDEALEAILLKTPQVAKRAFASFTTSISGILICQCSS